MNDYTRVNELQDKLLQAMDILNAKALRDIQFDKTILCSIEDDSERKDGKYIVNDGSRIFTAYSIDTSFRNGNNVYVTIPEGNYENQKMIIGKQTNTTEAPITFTTPFETIFDMTDNVVLGAQNGSLIANALDQYSKENKGYEYITLYDENCNYYNYSRMGIKANFKTWIKNAVKGNYGLIIIFTVKDSNTTSETDVETEYYYKFSNDDMYGNVYNFNAEQEQQLVIPLEEIKGTITHITINFYQEANFYDKFNIPLPCSEKGYQVDENNILIKDEDDNYLIYENDVMLEPNIFVNNIYVCFGYDLSIFNKDLVEIYTQNSKSYKHSNDTEDDGVEQNKKIIRTRWVHVKNGVPIAMDTSGLPEQGYEVRWYKYCIGAAAADAYSSVYWKRIEDASGFTYEFNPDINLQQEKIKIVILQDTTPYYSNELIFENEEDLPPSKEAEQIINALTIIPDDGLNGNYMIYGQDNSIKDTKYSGEIRTISAYFDLNENLEINKDTEKITDIQNLTWKFPTQNTMLQLLNAGGYETIELIQYEQGKYYIENTNEESEKDFIISENEELNLETTYYELAENGFYNKVTNFYIPNTYYIYGYVNCEGKSYDNNKTYYILNEEGTEYIADTVELSEYIQEPEKYYILDYIIDESDTKQDKQYYAYSDNSGIVNGKLPQYKISSYYSPSKSNNTVICQYMLNGRLYTTEKEFTFGPAGTMGTDQTLVIDFVGDKNSVYVTDQLVKFEVQLYDNQNKLQNISDGSVTWAWYYNSDKNDKLSTPEKIEKSTNAFLIFEGEDCTFNLDGLYILQASIGSLTTYFPIPVSNGQYSYITGPTQVIYQSSGEPAYNREEFLLYDKNEEIVDANWNILIKDNIETYQYLGKITQDKFQEYPITQLYTKNSSGKYIGLTSSSKYNENTIYYLATTNQYIGTINPNNNKLQPLGIYIEDAPVYGVQASINNTKVWTQPILVLQNKWANNVINAWDGKSLVMNESTSTILAAAISAGKKNSDDNTFSGVMIGNWKGQDVASDITEQTGVYGFHHGAMSYAWKDDGTGFIGKDGKGRINFDGNKATLYSSDWQSDLTTRGMEIDLNEPWIKMSKGNSTQKYIILDASRDGDINRANDPNAPFKIGTKFAVDWNGTLYAKNGHFEGTISASTLQAYSAGRSGTITLDGSIQINHTWEEDGDEYSATSYLGQIETGLPYETGTGLGMKIGNSVIKVTTANAGMSFNTDQYVSVSNSGQTAIGGKRIAIIGKSGNSSSNSLIVQNIKAENQYGIYARFA